MHALKHVFYELKLFWRALFLYPVERLNGEELSYDRYWDDKRPGGVSRLSGWQKKRADIILQSLKPRTSVSVGDVGCGDGAVGAYLREQGAVSRVTGYDLSEKALAMARKNGLETVLFDLQEEQDLEKLREDDFILMLEVLEHIPHAERALAKAYERARHGVFFSFPNTGFLSYRLRLLFGRFPVQWRVHPGEHLRFWTHRDLFWWLRAQGYRQFSIRAYKGIPGLNQLWPSLAAAGFIVRLDKPVAREATAGAQVRT